MMKTRREKKKKILPQLFLHRFYDTKFVKHVFCTRKHLVAMIRIKEFYANASQCFVACGKAVSIMREIWKSEGK